MLVKLDHFPRETNKEYLSCHHPEKSTWLTGKSPASIGNTPTQWIFQPVMLVFRGSMDVSKIGGKPPKWMVKIMENPIKMDDLGGKPAIFGNTRNTLGKFLEFSASWIQQLPTVENLFQQPHWWDSSTVRAWWPVTTRQKWRMLQEIRWENPLESPINLHLPLESWEERTQTIRVSLSKKNNDVFSNDAWLLPRYEGNDL